MAASQPLRTPMWKKNALEVDQRLQAKSGRVYRIVRFLARGGFSEVYEAVLESTGEVVAIKCLQLHRIEPKAVERTRREGKILALLKHPNIVRVYEYDVRDDGLIWMVMELLVGRTLRNLIEQTKPRVPVPWALRIGADLANALDALHEHAIHRDLKPENIHVSLDGMRVCVIDLGAGKVLKSALVTTDPRMSMGTLPYMSPEQLLEPKDVDTRSDLFALGIILFEMLTGRHPFLMENGEFAGWGALSASIIFGPHADFSSLARHVPSSIVAIIERLLQKDPNNRYPSAKAVRDLLEEVAKKYNQQHPSLALAEVAHTLAPEVPSEDDDLAFTSGERVKNPYLETPDPLTPFAVTESNRAAQPEAYSTTDKAVTPSAPRASGSEGSSAPAPSAVLRKITIPMSTIAVSAARSSAAPALKQTIPMSVLPSAAEPTREPDKQTALDTSYEVLEDEPIPEDLLDGSAQDEEARRAWTALIRVWNGHGPEAGQAVMHALTTPTHPALRVLASNLLLRFGGPTAIRPMLEQYAVERDATVLVHLQVNIVLLRALHTDATIDELLKAKPVSPQAARFQGLGAGRARSVQQDKALGMDSTSPTPPPVATMTPLPSSTSRAPTPTPPSSLAGAPEPAKAARPPRTVLATLIVAFVTFLLLVGVLLAMGWLPGLYPGLR